MALSSALDDFEDGKLTADPPEPEQPLAPGEDDFWGARPTLLHIHTFARARKVSPWAVLGVVLARIVAATPPSIVLPPIIGGRASLNLAVGIVGEPGAGKGAAEAVAEECIVIDHVPPLFSTHRLGSGQGIAHGYAYREKKKGGGSELVRHTDSCLFRMDEIDTITGLRNQRGSSTLMPELRSALMGEALGHLFVDPERRVEIAAHSYRLALTVGIQPTRSAVILDDSDGGTPQRFLWVSAVDPGAPEEPPPCPPAMRWRQHENIRWETVITVCAIARQAILDNRDAQLRGHGKPLEGHRLLLREKVAAALDILSGALEVSEEGWILAGVVQERSESVQRLCQNAIKAKRLAENRNQGELEGERAAIVAAAIEDQNIRRTVTTLLRHLNRGDWIPRNELRHKLRSSDRQYFDEAIDWLIADDRVTMTEADKGGTAFRVLLAVPREIGEMIE